MCGTTHKTVRRIVEAHRAGLPVVRKERAHGYDPVTGLLAKRVKRDSRSDFGRSGRPDGWGSRVLVVAWVASAQQLMALPMEVQYPYFS